MSKKTSKAMTVPMQKQLLVDADALHSGINDELKTFFRIVSNSQLDVTRTLTIPFSVEDHDDVWGELTITCGRG